MFLVVVLQRRTQCHRWVREESFPSIARSQDGEGMSARGRRLSGSISLKNQVCGEGISLPGECGPAGIGLSFCACWL
jgi:hypothetical protein